MEERRDVDKKMQLEELKANPRKVRFMRLCQMAEAFALRPEKEKEAIESIFETEYRSC